MLISYWECSDCEQISFTTENIELMSQKKIECAVQFLFTISCLHQRKK